MKEPLAHSETEGDGGQERALLLSNDMDMGSNIEIISKEIQDLKTEDYSSDTHLDSFLPISP